MAQNQELSNVVLDAVYEQLKENPGFKIMTEGNRELGVSVIESMGEHGVDLPYKFRIAFGRLIGYGYDFREEVDGVPAKEVYERAVLNTKRFSGREPFESFVTEGIVDKRYGYYITRI